MKLWAIAFNTFRENIRDKILYNLLVFAVLMIGLSIALGEMTIGEQERITTDVGLTSISIFGVLMSIFLGIGLVSKEIEKKTIYTLIAKPLPRYLFILGRFAGLMLTIGVNTMIMTAAFTLSLWYLKGGSAWPLTLSMVQAIFLIYLEFGVIIAAAMAFSTFSTPILSSIFTLSFVVIGRLTEGILEFAERSQDKFFHYGAQVLYYLAPNLNNYVMIDRALYDETLPVGLFLTTTTTGVVTTALLLGIAIVIFQRRDFV